MLPECPFCKGTGAETFETGPAVEICSQCRGTGRLLGSRRKVFASLLDEKGVFLDVEMRLLLVALAELEERLDAIERKDS